MNALDRADQTLARAQARRAGVVTPDSATSPMDHSSTVQIPRTLVNAVDPLADPDSTLVIPAPIGDAGTGTRADFGPAGRAR